jgi:hypothetical protein
MVLNWTSVTRATKNQPLGSSRRAMLIMIRNKRGPNFVLLIREHAHTTVPIAPEDLNDAIAAGVMSHGCGESGLREFGQG